MSTPEVNAIISAIHEQDKNRWEQLRWIGYITCLSNGAKLKTPQELVTFSWEKTENDATTIKDTRTPEEVRQSLLEIKNSL